MYIGSFWDRPLRSQENAPLLVQEKEDLLGELSELPRNAALRRINELVKRTRSVKVHAYIIHYLRKQMPYTFGKEKKQEKLINRLESEFEHCARRYNLPLGDFPNPHEFRMKLRQIKDITKFQKLDKSLVREMDRVLANDIAALLERCSITTKPQDPY